MYVWFDDDDDDDDDEVVWCSLLVDLRVHLGRSGR